MKLNLKAKKLTEQTKEELEQNIKSSRKLLAAQLAVCVLIIGIGGFSSSMIDAVAKGMASWALTIGTSSLLFGFTIITLIDMLQSKTELRFRAIEERLQK